MHMDLACSFGSMYWGEKMARKRRKVEMLEGWGAELERLRLARGWTQEELQARSGLGQSSISHYENEEKRPSMESLALLAGAFGMEQEDLARIVGRLTRRAEDDVARSRVPLSVLMQKMVDQYPELEPQFAERANDPDFDAQIETLAKVLGFTARAWMDEAD